MPARCPQQPRLCCTACWHSWGTWERPVPLRSPRQWQPFFSPRTSCHCSGASLRSCCSQEGLQHLRAARAPLVLIKWPGLVFSGSVAAGHLVPPSCASPQPPLPRFPRWWLRSLCRCAVHPEMLQSPAVQRPRAERAAPLLAAPTATGRSAGKGLSFKSMLSAVI